MLISPRSVRKKRGGGGGDDDDVHHSDVQMMIMYIIITHYLFLCMVFYILNPYSALYIDGPSHTVLYMFMARALIFNSLYI